MAQVTVTAGPVDQLEVDALVVPICRHNGAVEVVPTAGQAALEELFEGSSLVHVATSLGARGEAEELTRIPTLGRLPAAVVATVGVGKLTDDTSTTEAAAGWAQTFGAAVRLLAGTARVGLLIPSQADEAGIRAIAEGALLAAYSFDTFRAAHTTDEADTTRREPVREITLLVEADPGRYQTVLDRAAVVTQAVHLTRDLVNTPPSHLHPQELAEAAEHVGREVDVAVEVLDENALRDGGYGGILGVGQGSAHPPRLVTMRYQPSGGEDLPHVVFVGKGITFDSGGLSLKPPQAMETMKLDMAGAAAVIAAVGAVARLHLPVRVTGIAALAENLPSATAQRPSDVLTTRNGTTVEVLNTDAEGRLVLADALADACALQPELVVDVATLTGAQQVALGNRISAIMASDDTTREAITQAAQGAGEQMWPMPLPAQLRKSLDSAVADISNMGDRFGGMLTAGIFLQEFVTQGQPWAHLDIAGPAFNTGPAWGCTPTQATGVATRTLVEIAEQLAHGRLTLPARSKDEQ